jgi:predicted esterase
MIRREEAVIERIHEEEVMAELVVSRCARIARTVGALAAAAILASEPGNSNRRDARFTDPSPGGAELLRRFSVREEVPVYDLRGERFRIITPEEIGSPVGLFVWISPGKDPGIPRGWEPILAEHRLVFVGAYDGGNERIALDRFRLALDAVHNLKARFVVDPRRVYVAGFSGGGRVASMLGVNFAEVFTGTIAICGANFFQPVRAGAGGFYAAGYVADAESLRLAKVARPFVLITGEKDMNRENTRAVENGFRAAQFRHVKYLEVAGMGHVLPSGAVLRTALRYLENPQGVSSGQTTHEGTAH